MTSDLIIFGAIGFAAQAENRPGLMATPSHITLRMLMRETSDNLVQMFVGWEGVGLASDLLIGFWYQRPSANAAAIEAFVVNRVGDFGFALGIFAADGAAVFAEAASRAPAWVYE